MEVRTDQKARESENSRLSEKMIDGILLHFGRLDRSALSSYTVKRDPSHQAGAKSDLEICDAAGAVVFLGREFRGGVEAYWRPSRLTVVPEWGVKA